MLFTGIDRNFVQDLVDRARSRFDGSVSKLDIFSSVDCSIFDYSSDVWSAVENNVAFRLPHELKRSANCGEKAALLYAVARELRFRNLRFILYKTNKDRGTTHASVLFDYKEKTYFSDPSYDITNKFEISPRKIKVSDTTIRHHGLRCLSEDDLKSSIRGLRESDDWVLRLFGSGQYLIIEKTDNGAYEVFVTFNRKSLDGNERREPSLEVILLRDEPYNENTAVVLTYPAFDPNAFPRTITFFDLHKFYWGNIKGVCLVNYDIRKKVVNSVSDLDDENLLGMFAFLKYQRTLGREAKARSRSPYNFYLTHGRDRDLIARLRKETRKLKSNGNVEEAGEKEKQVKTLVEDVASKGDRYYERYCDFRVSTLWPLEKRGLSSYSGRKTWRKNLVEDYVGSKHLHRMDVMMIVYEDKLRVVREKIAEALG